MVLFGASAFFYRKAVKYMVKVGTPVPNGYRVKTLCTHGPFQYFQHPVYTALFGCSLSTPFVLDSACKPPSRLGLIALLLPGLSGLLNLSPSRQQEGASSDGCSMLNPARPHAAGREIERRRLPRLL